jgi:DNA-binding beta-propeller fold protein YncE
MNGDIYSVNNDTLGILTIFGHDAKGDAAPKRMLQTGGMYGVAVDEEAQEMFLSSQAGGVVIYKKMAQGHDRPIRRIQGNNTQMADSHGMAIDQKKGLIFVANWGTGMKHEPFTPGAAPAGGGDEGGGGAREIPGSGFFQPPSITVFPKDAKGDVAPLRVIQGSKTQMNWPTAVAVDPEHGEIYVANDTGHSITVYSEDANGDVAPIRVIKGPKSQIVNPHGLAYDTKHDELFVANFGNHAATVYSRTANGDATPLRIIRATPLDTPTPMMGNPHTVVYDANREQILVGD